MQDYHKFINDLNIEDVNLLKVVREFTSERLLPWEFDLFPGDTREKIENLLKMAQNFYDLPTLVEIENRIIEAMPFSFKHDMIMNKYFLPNRPRSIRRRRKSKKCSDIPQKHLPYSRQKIQ